MMIRFNQARDSSTVRPDLEKFIRRSATAAVTTAAIVLILRICLYTSCMIALAFVQMVSAAKARVENMLSIVGITNAIYSPRPTLIFESLLQLLDDGRFVLIHTGKSSFQLEPKRKARGLGSATQTPGLCMKNAPGRAEGRPSMKLFDAIILAFMEYR